MNTKPYSFMDIFGYRDENDEKIKLDKIVIPNIQRDYAQGRSEEKRVRDRFLDSLHKAITQDAIKLDFIYGDIDDDGVMTPLDGQQRLTTLFLLHWYAAKRANIGRDECDFLRKFSYETRYSARDFCKFLVGQFEPSFCVKLSEEICDQVWFPRSWAQDPTIKAMLIMLDAIDEKFAGVKNIWQRLKDRAITFYFLPIKDMGLTDELYIKMNSRGKPLTRFEHFKAEFEREVRKIDKSLRDEIMPKIDREWTDLLWDYRGEDNIIDDEFLRYFAFVCDIICYKEGKSPIGKEHDEFELLKEYFNHQKEKSKENIEFLMSCFDCWCKNENKPSKVFGQFVSNKHERGRIVLSGDGNLFNECLRDYDIMINRRNRKFTLNKTVLLYAFVIFVQNRDEITDTDFARRIRVINNLVLNSEDEIRTGGSGNRMPRILCQVEEIVLNGRIDTKLGANFNENQLGEETAKLGWTKNNSEWAEDLFELEDHELLYGQISIVGMDNPELFERFKLLFDCNPDLIDCAMLSVGNYARRDTNGWRYQLGTSNGKIKDAWQKLLHKSSASGFEETGSVLRNLLSGTDKITDEYLKSVISSFIEKCEDEKLFDWRYYYIKYDVFRPGRYGRYCWNNEVLPYEMSVLWTPLYWSVNTYQPFLKAVDEEHLSTQSNGQWIELDGEFIMCKNSAYVFYDENDVEIRRIDIMQENGIDKEDRILKMKNYLKNI